MRTSVPCLVVICLLGGLTPAALADDGPRDEARRFGSLFPFGIAGLPGSERKQHAGKRRREAILRGLRWLAAHQSPEGVWEAAGFHRWCEGQPVDGPRERTQDLGQAHYDPGVTGLALCAFLGAGFSHTGTHPFAGAIARGLDYLTRIQDAEGCCGPRTATNFIYNHAFGSLALVEAYVRSGDPALRAPAQRAIDFTLRARNPGFGWRYGVRPGDNDTSASGCMVVPLALAWHLNESALEAGLDEPFALGEKAFRGTLRWLDRMTDPTSGSVGYTFRGSGAARSQGLMQEFPSELSESMTAVGLLCRRFLPRPEAADDGALIEKGEARLMRLLPRWTPGSGHIDLYYWYYGMMAMRFADRTRWAAWDKALVEALLGAQEAGAEPCGDGGSWPPLDPWGADGGRVYATSMALLMLETGDRLRAPPGDRSDLLEALETPALDLPTKARVVRALGLHGVRGGGDRLVAYVSGGEPDLRRAAGDALEILDVGAERTHRLVALLDDGEHEVRRTAMQALRGQARHVGPHVRRIQPHLVGEDPGMAFDAAWILGRSGHPDALPHLREALGSQHEGVRVAAATGIVRLAGAAEDVVPHLVAGLGSRIASVQIEAAGGVAALGSVPDSAEGALLGALGAESEAVRTAAAAVLVTHAPLRSRAVGVLASVLRSDRHRLRRQALQALARAGPDAAPATQELVSLLLRGPRTLRPDTAKVLGGIGAEAREGAAALRFYAAHGRASVRAACEAAYASLGVTPPAAIRHLVPALGEDDPRLVGGAVLGLVEHGRDVVPALAEQLLAPEHQARWNGALRALAGIGPDADGATEAIAPMLAVSEELGLRAVEALASIAKTSDRARRLLTDALLEDGHGARLRAAAARSLGTLGALAEPVISEMLPLLGHANRTLRDATVEALAALGPHSLPHVERTLRLGVGEARLAAARVVTRIGPPAADLVAVLDEILATDPGESAWGDALAAIGKPAVRTLMKRLRSVASRVRSEAARVLGEIGPDARAALALLRTLQRTDDTRSVASQAAAAIRKIRGKP